MLRCALRAAGLAAQRLPAALASTPAGAAGCAAGVRMLTATCAATPTASLACELQRLAFLPLSVRALHVSVRTVQRVKAVALSLVIAFPHEPASGSAWRVRQPSCAGATLYASRAVHLHVQALAYKEQTWCACR